MHLYTSARVLHFHVSISLTGNAVASRPEGVRKALADAGFQTEKRAILFDFQTHAQTREVVKGRMGKQMAATDERKIRSSKWTSEGRKEGF